MHNTTLYKTNDKTNLKTVCYPVLGNPYRYHLKFGAYLSFQNLITLWLGVLLTSQAFCNEDVTNERLPVTNHELQQHWQVDCVKLERLVFKAYTDTNIAQVLLNDLNQAKKELLLCSIIYDRYAEESKPCNAFKKILELLKSIPNTPKADFSPNGNIQWFNALDCAKNSTQTGEK